MIVSGRLILVLDALSCLGFQMGFFKSIEILGDFVYYFSYYCGSKIPSLREIFQSQYMLMLIRILLRWVSLSLIILALWLDFVKNYFINKYIETGVKGWKNVMRGFGIWDVKEEKNSYLWVMKVIRAFRVYTKSCVWILTIF